MVTSLGVMLPISDIAGTGIADIAAAATHLEAIGADTIWAGDHLAFHAPIVESCIALSVAGAVTERARLGFGVMLLALRQPAWAAKQISSLQAVSGGRVVLGVGVGGENPAEWAAAGVPLRERATRTDAVLAALPDLLSGHRTTLPAPHDLVVPPLLPAGGLPPIWVGGRSAHALRRAVRFGDGWLGMWADRRRVERTREQLAVIAEQSGRTAPRTGLHVFVHIGDDASAREETAAFIQGQYRLDFAAVERYVALGSANQVSDHLLELHASGVEEFLLHPAAADHTRQYDLLGDLLRALRPLLSR